MKKYIRLYRSSGSDPPIVIHDHVAEHYGLQDGDTVPHDLLPAVLDDCRKLNDMFYQIETAKKRGAAMNNTVKHSDLHNWQQQIVEELKDDADPDYFDDGINAVIESVAKEAIQRFLFTLKLQNAIKEIDYTK